MSAHFVDHPADRPLLCELRLVSRRAAIQYILVFIGQLSQGALASFIRVDVLADKRNTAGLPSSRLLSIPEINRRLLRALKSASALRAARMEARKCLQRFR